MTHGADHADDRVDVGVARRTEIERTPDRIAVREVLLREELVDDHVARVRVPVRAREPAALLQRNAHRGEVIFVDAPQSGVELRALVLAADDAEHLAGVGAGERQRRCESRLRDTGQAAHLVEYALEHARLRRFVVILGVGQRDRRGQHALAREAWILLQDLAEAAQQEAGARKQRDRERELRDDERVAREPRTASAAREASAFAQHAALCARARTRQDRQRAEQRAGEQGKDERGRQHRRMRVHIDPVGQKSRCRDDARRRPAQRRGRARRRSMRAASPRQGAAARCAHGSLRARIARRALSAARTSARASGWRHSRRRSAAPARRRTGSAAARARASRRNIRAAASP